MPVKMTLNKGNVPVKIYTDEVESSSLNQLEDISKLPFIHHHVAAMPDVHTGIGATIGSVIPMKGAIVPAAVGVDIGCFVGDTKIPLLDGTEATLKELTERGEECWVYVVNAQHQITGAKAFAKLTRKNASLMRVVLDNEAEIICTPDHQFMLRDGSWCEAENLQPKTSLMPFYSHLDKEGYRIVTQPSTGSEQRFHWSLARTKVLGSIPSVHNYNHKVKSVESLLYREDVYCLTVPEYENFALSAGVFVHNCGMNAIRLSLTANDLPDNLKPIRLAIEEMVPVGFDQHKVPQAPSSTVQLLDHGIEQIFEKHPGIAKMLKKPHHTWTQQLGTLGGGNHFIELCLDENQDVWVMLHSGSRGIGNTIGTYFINLAKKDIEAHSITLPNRDLAYFREGAQYFDDYVEAVHWAQEYAMHNRREMMRLILDALRKQFPHFEITKEAINCHHNYVAIEEHFGETVYLTRKGAIRAGEGELGIIPGSMGAKSFIVRGKGNPESFCSCFPGHVNVLTNRGLLPIKDVYESDSDIQLVSYYATTQQFEYQSILDKSKRLALVQEYRISQTGRRKNNVISCTADHPFATYQDSELLYQEIESLCQQDRGVISPHTISVATAPIVTDYSLCYLLGLILSDGTIYLKDYESTETGIGRPRQNQYQQRAYVRFYQSAVAAKSNFVHYVFDLLKSYTQKISYYETSARSGVYLADNRVIQGEAVKVISVHDQSFITQLLALKNGLSSRMLSDRQVALNFLAGFIDGDGTYTEKNGIDISVGKAAVFRELIPALLSAGACYRVYNNRNHYMVEFRNTAVLSQLSSLCQRVQIANVPKRKYGDQLVLASSLLHRDTDYLRGKARRNNLVSLDYLSVQEVDRKLSMNRIKKGESTEEVEVYNFTVANHHNYVVFSDYYTPLLVHNCSHGAGRRMSRTEAKKRFSHRDMEDQTKGVECRKDKGVVDEIPQAYKDIDQVMEYQNDLVDVVHTLKQVVCVKG